MNEAYKRLAAGLAEQKKANVALTSQEVKQRLNPVDEDFLSTFEPQSRSLGDVVGDTANALAKSAVNLGQMGYGLVDLATRYNAPAMIANKLAEQGIGQPVQGLDAVIASLSEDRTGLYPNFAETKQIIDEGLASDVSKKQRASIAQNQQEFAKQVDAEVAEDIKAGANEYLAKGKGVARKFANTVDQYLENPSQIAEMSIEQLPQLLIGGIGGKAGAKLATVGKSAKETAEFLATNEGKKAVARMSELAGVGTTALTEGLSNAAQARGEIEALNEEALQGSPEYLALRKTMSHDDAKAELGRRAFDQVFGQTALMAGVVSKLTGAGKFEGNLFTGATSKGLVSSGVNALREGTEETLQSGGGQFIQNVAKQELVDPNTDVLSNISEAAGAGAIAGAALGGGLTFAASSPEILSEAGQATAKAANKIKETVSKASEPAEVKEARKTGNVSKLVDTANADYRADYAIDALLSPEFIPAKGVDEADADYQSRVDTYVSELDVHLDKLEDDLAKALANENPEEAKRLNGILNNTIDAQNSMFESLSRGDLNSAIEAANAATGKEAEKVIQTVLGSKDFYTADLKELEALNASNNLTPIQKSAVKAAIENKKAVKDVSNDILNGSKDFLGINDYSSLVNKSLVNEDFTLAKDYIKGLKKFADNQFDKASRLKNAYDTAKAENNAKGIQVKVGDRDYRIHKGSGNFVSTVVQDSNAINNVLKNLVQQYRETAQISTEAKTARAPANVQPNTEINSESQIETVEPASQGTVADAPTPAQPKVDKEAKAETVPVKPKTPKKKATPVLKPLNTTGEVALKLRSKGKLKSDQLQDMTTSGKKIDLITKGINEAEIGLYVRQVDKNNLISKEGDLNQMIAVHPDTDFLAANEIATTVPLIKNSIKNSLNKVVDTSYTDGLRNNLGQLLSETTSGNLGNDLNDRVLDAITYSALEHLNKSGANYIKPDSTQLKRTLDLDSKENLSRDTLRLLRDNPVLAYDMIADIGKVVVNSLGLKAKKDSNKATQTALETGLGQLAYLSLIEQGIIEEVMLKGADINATLQGDVYSPKFKDKNSYAFVKVRNPERFNELVDISKTVSPALGAILGNDVSRAYPTFNPQPAPETTTVNDQKVSTTQKAAIEKYNKQKYYFNTPLMNSLDVLGKDFLREIEGYKSDLESLHVLDRESQEVINNGIDKQIDELNNLRTVNAENRAMYFSSVVDIQNRIRIDNTLVNPQSYKIQRHLLQMDAWKSNIKTQAQREVFKLALGQAFGLDIDKQSNKATVEAIDYVLAGDNELSNLLFDTAKQLTNVTEANKKEVLANLKKVFDKHSFEAKGKNHTIELHGTHSLAALYAMANYSPTETFETSVFLEVDGITNGTAIGLLQLAPFANEKTAIEYLEKTGMYGKAYRSYGEFKEAGNDDNYETLAASMQRIIKNMNDWGSDLSQNANQMQAVGNILGTIGEVNDLTLGLIRKVAKNPVMTGNYGAGVSKIITGLENEVIDKFYVHLMKGVNAKDQKYLDILQQQLSTAVGYNVKRITVANGKNWVLTSKDTDALRSTVQATLGGVMQEALEETFGALMDSRNTLNKIMEVGNQAFLAAYNYEKGKVTAETGRFDSQQEAAVLKKLNRIIPKVAHAKSDTMRASLEDFKANIGSKNLEAKYDSLKALIENVYDPKLYSKAQKEFKAYDKVFEEVSIKVTDLKELTDTLIDLVGNSYTIDSSLQLANKEAVADPKNVGSRVTTKLKNSSKKSKNTTVPVLEYADTLGVRPAVMLIQSIDSANMVNYLNSQANGMNIYDAIITGVSDAALGTNALNKGMYENNFDYSIYKAANDYTNRALAYFNKEYGNVKSPELDKARQFLAKEKLADVTVRNNELEKVNANRQMMKGQLEYIDQYYLQGAGYRTDVGKADPKEVTEGNLNGAIKEYVDSAIDEILGSKQDSTPFSGTPTEYDIKASTIGGILNMMRTQGDSRTSDTHFTYLKSLLEKTYQDAIYPLKLKLYNSVDESAGIFDDSNDLVEVNVNTGTPYSNAQMSAEEVFAHEMVHAITKHSVMTNSNVSLALNKLFREAKKKIKPSDLQESYMTAQQAKERWNYVFNNGRKVAGTNYSVGMLEFVAFGMTNEKFKQALDLKASQLEARDDVSLLERVINIFETFLDSLYRIVGKQRINLKNKGLNELVKALVKSELKAKNAAYTATISGKADEIIKNNVNRFVLAPLTKIAESSFISNNRFKTVQALGTVTALTAKGGLGEFKKALDTVFFRMGLTENNLLISLMENIAGRNDVNSWAMELNRKSKRMIDQMRAEIAANTQKILISKFQSKPTSEEEIAITRLMLKTDLQSLYGLYGAEEIGNILKDAKRVDVTLRDLENKIKTEFANEQKFYILQSKSLANYLVKGRYTQRVGLQNSHLIANLALTTETFNGNSQRAEQLIDAYTSLQAYSLARTTYPESAKAFDVLIEKESKASLEDNGVTFALLTHKHFLEKSLKESFKGNKTQTVKGYVKEIFNPSISFKVAPLSDKDSLEVQGYTYRGLMSKDKDDKLGSIKMGIFVNENAGLDTWQAGGINLTGLNAKGAEYFEVLAQTGLFDSPTSTAANALNSLTAAKTRIGNEIYKGKDSSKDNYNTLVPIFDELMNVTGYRYLMSEENKDLLLERDNRFSHVLGATEGNFISKQNSVEINEEYIQALHDDYKANHTANKKSYVLIGEKADSEEYRELYRMLPYSAKKQAEALFKTKGLYVRREVLKMAFGQRKFSLTSFARAKAKLISINDQVAGAYMLPIYKILGGKAATSIAKMWTDLIKLTKDVIVIRSGVTLLGNITSNNLLLWSMGVPYNKIGSTQLEAARLVKEYDRELERIRAIDLEINAENKKNPVMSQRSLATVRRLEAERTELEDSLERNPVTPLIRAGVYQSIIEDTDEIGTEFTKTTPIETFMNSVGSRVSPSVKRIGKEAVISPETQTYKMLRNLTQLSDFAARYTLHQYNLDQGMSVEDSLNMIEDTFVNYDLPSHKSVQYMNDIGAVMFTKFFLRIQRVIYHLVTKRPARLITLMMLQDFFNYNVADIADSNPITKDIGMMFNTSPVDAVDGVITAHPVYSVIN